jgi:transcription-repair coupling factor (mfd)
VEWSKSAEQNLQISGLNASARAFVLSCVYEEFDKTQVIIANDDDEAAYMYNDLRQILSVENVYFFPSSYKKAIKITSLDTANQILRTEVLNRLANHQNHCIIVTYPEAILQKTVSLQCIQNQSLKLRTGESTGIDFLSEVLFDYGFERVDFVYEPGQFSIRGSIVDIFSFSYEMPYRIDFFGDEIESIRVFDIETQLSKELCKEVEIIPDLQKSDEQNKISFFEFISKDNLLIFNNATFVRERINTLYDEALVKANEGDEKIPDLHSYQITGREFWEQISDFRKIEISEKSVFNTKKRIDFNISIQPIFHKNFDLIAENLRKFIADGYKLYILSDSVKQTDRIAAIFADRADNIVFQPVKNTLHEGFIDHDLSIVIYTDHQIFDRFHKYQLRTDYARRGKAVMTLKELNQFTIGDYLVHVDHGVGVFSGLVRTNVNGTMQEMVKLVYQNNDIIFVSIHSLHRISKYKGKEGTPPKINKLGSGAWDRLKERTKSKIKDIARELIKLYAARKSEQGFAFSPDSYLQHELEASFIYEDTPDQTKATTDVKHDMESTLPMDRLICGDVGFGKTEIAMRAAFKSATDGKQTAVLVPTTVLALQHYNSFKDRFKNFPVTVEYISRARTAAQTKEILEKLKDGKIDIIIGTHKLIGKSVKFKDLGLLVIDEEQKFGVSVKEKLKEIKVNVDTLTMTATPIPRTLQFSLMGARDLSIISTPPPNRFPIQTEIHQFDEDVIREAIQLEMSRNGQVFFINNRIQSIYNIENTVRRLVPGCRVVVGHGQMPPDRLEEIIVDFMNYDYDVLISTTIIESGIDIPNVNTIIINSAHYFGLSDLHQLRGRVGRSNRKAYCYLLAPELSLLTVEARRRLQALETFAELGSGFNIAMQDLDIRGAGNMLGAEQSGFIADLGYETYQRILNEAVVELKNDEFAELYAEESENTPEGTLYVADCQIDTDMELLFGQDYIENVSERITLYQELDNLKNESELLDFEKRVKDRFGKIPEKAASLMQVVRLRWLSMRYGVEKLILKNNRMTAFLVTNEFSSYYKSNNFGKILRYMTLHPHQCKLREQNGKRSVVFEGANNVERALKIMKEIDGLLLN